MIKKTLLFLLVAIFAFCVPLQLSAYAEGSKDEPVLSYIETYDDGSYSVITITVVTDPSKASTSGQKSFDYYNSNHVLQWSIYLNGTFTYTGSSATCTAASTSYSISNNSWTVTKAKASRSGATATGEFTVKRYELGVLAQTVNKTLTLTCSATGVLS